MGEIDPTGKGGAILDLHDNSWATLRDLGENERQRDIVFEHYPALGRPGEYMLSHIAGNNSYDFFVVNVSEGKRSSGQFFRVLVEDDSAYVHTIVIPDDEVLAASQTGANGEAFAPEQLVQQVDADMAVQVVMGLSLPSKEDIETFRDAVASWSRYSDNRSGQ